MLNVAFFQNCHTGLVYLHPIANSSPPSPIMDQQYLISTADTTVKDILEQPLILIEPKENFHEEYMDYENDLLEGYLEENGGHCIKHEHGYDMNERTVEGQGHHLQNVTIKPEGDLYGYHGDLQLESITSEGDLSQSEGHPHSASIKTADNHVQSEDHLHNGSIKSEDDHFQSECHLHSGSIKSEYNYEN